MIKAEFKGYQANIIDKTKLKLTKKISFELGSSPWKEI